MDGGGEGGWVEGAVSLSLSGFCLLEMDLGDDGSGLTFDCFLPQGPRLRWLGPFAGFLPREAIPDRVGLQKPGRFHD